MRILITFNERVSTPLFCWSHWFCWHWRIYFHFLASLDALANNNNYDVTVIGYLGSYFEYFEFHDTPIAVNVFTTYLMHVDSIFFQYSSFSSLPLLKWIPLMSFLVVVGPPFLQYIWLPGLPSLVMASNLKPLESIRIMQPPSCAIWLMIDVLQFHTSFRWILSTCFYLVSYSASY